VLCAHNLCSSEENGIANEAVVLELILTKAVHCAVKNAAVLYESWTSLSEKYFHFSFGQLATFWLGTFVMLFHACRSLVGHETLMVYFVIKVSNLIVFERLFGIND